MGDLFGHRLPVLQFVMAVAPQRIHLGPILREVADVEQRGTGRRPLSCLVAADPVGKLQLRPHRLCRVRRQALEFLLDVAALAGVGAQLGEPHQVALAQFRAELGIVLDLRQQRLAVLRVAALLTERHQRLSDLRVVSVFGIGGPRFFQF